MREAAIRGWPYRIKRGMDVTLAALGLVVLSPLLAVMAKARPPPRAVTRATIRAPVGPPLRTAPRATGTASSNHAASKLDRVNVPKMPPLAMRSPKSAVGISAMFWANSPW